MTVAIYPGSFDPITNGHLEILRRALIIFDKVIILVAVNSNKKSIFTPQKKVEMIKDATKEYGEHVSVESSNLLTIEVAQKYSAKAIIRGLRALTDFEHEFQLAAANRYLNPNIETLFLMADHKYSFISSSAIKVMSDGGADISRLVPKAVEIALDNIKTRP